MLSSCRVQEIRIEFRERYTTLPELHVTSNLLMNDVNQSVLNEGEWGSGRALEF